MKLVVGSSKVKFSVHKEMLCGVSSFFKSALNGSFREGREQTITLPEDDPDIFDLFVQWLYTKNYEIQGSDGRLDQTFYTEAVQLYCLADKYDVSTLRSHIHQAFDGKMMQRASPPTREDAAALYDGTNPGAPLRSYLLGWWMYRTKLDYFLEEEVQTWLSDQPEITLDLFRVTCSLLKVHLGPDGSMLKLSSTRSAYN